MRAKTMMGDRQCWFAFGFEVVKSVRRSAVLSFTRVTKGGKDAAVRYSEWLEWASALNSVN